MRQSFVSHPLENLHPLMYGGEDGVVSGVSTRGKGLVGMEHTRDNGCPAWGPLSVSEFAFVSHELPLYMKFHPLM